MKKISYKYPIFIFIFLVVIISLFYVTNNKKTYAIENKVEFPNTINISGNGDEIISEGINKNDGVKVEKIFSDNNQVFSTNINSELADKYTKSDKITDKGLLYIVENANLNSGIKDLNGNLLDNDFQTWIMQSTIWLYLHEKGIIKLDTNTIYNIKNCKVLISDNNKLVEKNTIYNTYIKDVIDNALKIGNDKEYLKIYKEDKVYSTKNNKYYQSSKIEVITNKSDSFKNYRVNVINGVDGIKIVNSEGKEIDNNTLMDAADVFYVRIPKKKDNLNKSITIEIVGNFDNYIGYKYKANNFNDIYAFNKSNYELKSNFKINFNNINY